MILGSMASSYDINNQLNQSHQKQHIKPNVQKQLESTSKSTDFGLAVKKRFLKLN